MKYVFHKQITWKLDGQVFPGTATVTAVFNICFVIFAVVEMGSAATVAHHFIHPC